MFFSAPELVCELGSRDRSVLLGHVRTQLRHIDIELQLVKDGGHSGPCLLQVVMHRLRKADAVKPAEQRLEIGIRLLRVHERVIELFDKDPPEYAELLFQQPAIVEEWNESEFAAR